MTAPEDQSTEAPDVTAERIDNERFQTFRDLMTRAASQSGGTTTYYLGQAGLELLTEIEWLRSRLVAWDHDLSATTAEREEVREWAAAWKAVAKRISVSRNAFRYLSGRHLDRLRELEEIDKEHADCSAHLASLAQQVARLITERDDARRSGGMFAEASNQARREFVKADAELDAIRELVGAQPDETTLQAVRDVVTEWNHSSREMSKAGYETIPRLEAELQAAERREAGLRAALEAIRPWAGRHALDPETYEGYLRIVERVDVLLAAPDRADMEGTK